MKALFDLSTRTALVTGASNGIGRAIAIGLAEYGADVAVHYSAKFDVENGEKDSAIKTVEAIRALGRRSIAIDLDIAERNFGEKLNGFVADSLSPPEIVVLNASVQKNSLIGDQSNEDFDWQINANLRSSIGLIKAAAPEMVRRSWGRILAVGSVQIIRPSRNTAVYAATKGALHNLMIHYAKEYAGDGITCNTVSPDYVVTARGAERRRTEDGWRARVASRNPMGRICVPEDIAGAAILLCSDAGRAITGVNLYVTAGAHLPYAPSELPHRP